jgi:molybdopterin/thiamine biosynthesis adenylyltransferase
VKPWWERYPDAYTSERAHWIDKGFVEDHEAGCITFTGGLTTSLIIGGKSVNRTFTVKVIYPPGYPNFAPDVEFIEPKISRSRHMAAGQPCLFQPELWRQDIPASAIERQILRWLGGYQTGKWRNELPVYELPAYYGYATPTVFMADGTLATMDGRDRGTFKLTKLYGVDIAVIESVDGNRVGTSLIQDLDIPTAGYDNGHWFRLAEEPDPVYTTAELAALLETHGHRLKERAPRPRVLEPIGLVFEDRHLGRAQWLMLDYGVNNPQARRPIAKGWDVRAPQVHLVSPDALFKRLNGVRDTAALDEKQVTVFGVGAVGSHLTLRLARDAVGSFVLCDPDRLTPGNITRHALDLTSVGQYKADAMQKAVYRTNPFCEAHPVTNGLRDPASIAQHFIGSDLVVAAIGDDVVEELLTDIAVAEHRDVPVLTARTVHAGAVIRIMLNRPGRDACMHCLGLHRDDRHVDWIEIPDDDLPAVHDDGCAAPSRPGDGLTSEEAGLYAARHAVDLLEGRDDETNHWVYVRRPIAGADARLGQIGAHSFTFGVHPDCPRCAV